MLESTKQDSLMSRCPTVTIQSDGGPVIINESDFDPKTQKLHGEKKKPAPKKKADPKAK